MGMQPWAETILLHRGSGISRLGGRVYTVYDSVPLFDVLISTFTPSALAHLRTSGDMKG